MLSLVIAKTPKKSSISQYFEREVSLIFFHPVYRQHSQGKFLISKSQTLLDFDSSYSDFTNSSFEECDFTKCVILFAEPAQAKTSGSKLCCETSVRDSKSVEMKADQREGTKTSLLDPNVDGACLDSVKPSIGGNSLDGANIFDDITGNNGELNHNESKYK